MTASMCFVSRSAASPSTARVKLRFAFASPGAALSAICAAAAASSRSPRAWAIAATTSAARAPWLFESISGRSTRSALVTSPAR